MPVLSPTEIPRNFIKTMFAFRYAASNGKCRGFFAHIGTSFGAIVGLVWAIPHYFFKLLFSFYQNVFVSTLRKIGVFFAKRGDSINPGFDLEKNNFIGHWFMGIEGICACFPFSVIFSFLSAVFATITTLLSLGGRERFREHQRFFNEVLPAIIAGILSGVFSVVLYPIHFVIDNIATLFFRFDQVIADAGNHALADYADYYVVKILSTEDQKKIINIRNYRADLSPDFRKVADINQSGSSMQPHSLVWIDPETRDSNRELDQAKRNFNRLTASDKNSDDETDFSLQHKALQTTQIRKRLIPRIMNKTIETDVARIKTELLTCVTVLAKAKYYEGYSQHYAVLQITFSYLYPEFVTDKELGLIVRAALDSRYKPTFDDYFSAPPKKKPTITLDKLNRDMSILSKNPVFLDNLHSLLEEWTLRYIYRSFYTLSEFVRINKGYMENYYNKAERKHYLTDYKTLMRKYPKNEAYEMRLSLKEPSSGSEESSVDTTESFSLVGKIKFTSGLFFLPRHVSIQLETNDQIAQFDVLTEYISLGWGNSCHNERMVNSIATLLNYQACLKYHHDYAIEESSNLPSTSFSR